MEKPSKHIFLCASFRVSGEPQGICHKKGSVQLLPYLESELSDRGMNGISISSTGCLKACEKGPVMVIYPDNVWYGGVESEDVIDGILDAMEGGGVAEDYVLG